jgi:hypothetical protein
LPGGQRGNHRELNEKGGRAVYIGGGVLALIVIVMLLVWLL